MKWFSVKKYTPTIHSACFLLRLENEKNFWFLSLGECDSSGNWLDWDHKDPIEFDDYKVTHFCVPEPIEIEE